MHISLDTTKINDWDSFHQVCKETFGFPDFYGMNMDAWIDCMSYLVDGGMTNFALEIDESLTIQVNDSDKFKKRVPYIFDALVEETAFVNQEYADAESSTRIALVFTNPE